MTDEFREAMVLGIELTIFGLLVVIIVCFGAFADKAFYVKSMEDASRMEIVEFRNFYEFTHGNELDIDYLKEIHGIQRNTSGTFNGITEAFAKENGSEVTGDDILRFIALYTYEYDVIVYTDSFDLALTAETQPDGWSLTYLSDKFEEKLGNLFYCFAVYDEYNHMYDSIVFYEKST